MDLELHLTPRMELKANDPENVYLEHARALLAPVKARTGE